MAQKRFVRANRPIYCSYHNNFPRKIIVLTDSYTHEVELNGSQTFSLTTAAPTVV